MEVPWRVGAHQYASPVKVFISWSGDESRQIAQALRSWLPMIFESVEPYMSERDNEAGVRWGDVIATELGESDFGILCLTPTNLTAPWLLFEAGALGKSFGTARVVPLLWRVSTTDVKSPLSQFHMQSADRVGIQAVVRSINATLGGARSDEALAGAFEGLWPRLDQMLGAVKAPEEALPGMPQRSDRELLEEILDIVRSARQDAVPTSLRARLEYDQRTLQRRRMRVIDEFMRSLPRGTQSELLREDNVFNVIVKTSPEGAADPLRERVDRFLTDAADPNIRVILEHPGTHTSATIRETFIAEED